MRDRCRDVPSLPRHWRGRPEIEKFAEPPAAMPEDFADRPIEEPGADHNVEPGRRSPRSEHTREPGKKPDSPGDKKRDANDSRIRAF